MGEVEDEDSNQGEPEKKAMMYEPTQAYPGKEDENKVFTYFDRFSSPEGKYLKSCSSHCNISICNQPFVLWLYI